MSGNGACAPEAEPGGGVYGSWALRLAVTFFSDYAAQTKREEEISLAELARRIRNTSQRTKGRLPWLKLARFGDQRTDKNSLRHDGNVLTISGLEADYDGGEVSVDHALQILAEAGVLSIVYTSPSHSETSPRWRVLCPTSAELHPQERSKLFGRLNGLFQGIFSAESWTLSQSYYFGSVNSNPAHRVELVDGAPIDQMSELDAIWRGKPGRRSASSSAPAGRRLGQVDEEALLREITSGASYHAASVRLLGKWARNGVPYMDARARVIAAMEAIPLPDRDARWHDRRADVDRCLEAIYGKEARARDQGRRAPQAWVGRADAVPDADADPWPEPVDFLAAGDLVGTPELRANHLPEALYPFVVDTAARMGVDPASVALATLVACASVADDHWQLQPKRHDYTWTESPRLWGGILGDPSVLKTPVIRACTKPLDLLDAEARRRHAEDMRRHQAEMSAWKAAGGDPAVMPVTPLLDRYLVEGTTIEALSEALRSDSEAKQRAPAGKVLLRQDEMAEWIAGFDRYRTGGRGGADRGAFLRLYNGGRYTIDRVGRGSFAVANWSACVLGGIQPEPIQRIAREAADDGLLQRFMYCVPARHDDGEDRAPDQDALSRYAALFPALAALHPAAASGIPAADARPAAIVALHADAHRHRLAINDLARAMAAMPDTSNRLKAAFGKWPGLFARLALTFHLIEIADARARGLQPPMLTVVVEATARRAANYMREILLPHLLRAEAVMFSTAQTGHARWIAGFILVRGQPRIALRDVVQAYGPLRAPECRRELLEVMETLVTVGWLRPEAQSNPARPPAAWTVNPAVLSIFAARAEREREMRTGARRCVSDAIARAAPHMQAASP